MCLWVGRWLSSEIALIGSGCLLQNNRLAMILNKLFLVLLVIGTVQLVHSDDGEYYSFPFETKFKSIIPF